MEVIMSRDLLGLVEGGVNNLERELRADPSLVNERDEWGNTLLHYAAGICDKYHWHNIKPILNVLFNQPGIDLNIKNNDGYTFVDAAVDACKHIHWEKLCAPRFVFCIEKAAALELDCNSLSNDGKTILHTIAGRETRITTAIMSGNVQIRKGDNLVQALLDNMPRIALDTLSAEGKTALIYAYEKENLEELNALLKAGADPRIGTPESLIAKINSDIQRLNNLLNNPAMVNHRPHSEKMRQTALRSAIARRETLLEKLLPLIEEHEVRKNVRILGQALRGSSSFLSKKKVPAELLAKIAGHTRVLLAQEEAEKIAVQNLFKPKIPGGS